MAGDAQTVSFRNETSGGGTFGAVLGAFLFIGAATLFLSGVTGHPWPARLIGALVFGFFGVLMAASAISALRRRGDDRAIEIGPDGLWLPEMGNVPWSAIAEVRTESMRGAAPGFRFAPATARYRRLGVSLVDPTVRPSVTTRLESRMATGYFAFLRQIAPELRVGGDDPAPFGVPQYQVARSWDQILESVGKYTTIVDVDERAARERALRRSASAASVEETPAITGASLLALDSAIAKESSVSGRPAVRSDPGLPGPVSEGQPRATFGPSATTAKDLVGSAIWMVGPLLIFTFLAASALPSGSAPYRGFPLPFLLLFGVSMAAPGAISIWRGVRRMRQTRAGPVRLTVGPEGMWLPEMGNQSWDGIGEVRVERAGWTRARSGLRVERWRLAVTTMGVPAGRVFHVESDLLGARFDDVIDLIRFYHPVVEV